MKTTGVFLGLILGTLVFLGSCAIGVNIAMNDRDQGTNPKKAAPAVLFGLGAPVFGWLAFRGVFNLFRDRHDQELKEQAAARQRAEEARRKAQQHTDEQQALHGSLTSRVNQSAQMASELPKLVKRADRALDLAEKEFAEGVFSPFWEAIEQAVKNLAQFTAHTDAIVRHARQHREEAPRLDGTPPPFQIGVDTLPDASRVADRMRVIVRRAQKNPHFESIYQQRKTNQLLVQGFNSLTHAITDLGDRIENSLDQLSSELSVGFSDLASAQREATETLSKEHQLSREQAAEDSAAGRGQSARESAARREHEEKQLEKLDNIQRRRKPPI